MQFRLSIAVIAVLTLISATVFAVVVKQQVTPEYLETHPQAFAVKSERRDDGLVQFTVTRKPGKPHYLVATLTIRRDDSLVAETSFPAFVREDSVVYHFAVRPEHLAQSEFEISERSFGDDERRPVPLPGGTDYQILLKDFAPE